MGVVPFKIPSPSMGEGQDGGGNRPYPGKGKSSQCRFNYDLFSGSLAGRLTIQQTFGKQSQLQIHCDIQIKPGRTAPGK